MTAGNSSPPERRRRLPGAGERGKGGRSGAEPLARVVATGAAGVDPAYMGAGPIPATRLALERAGLTIDDIDLVELNEAFAAQVAGLPRELEIPHDKLNVNGGAIAIGHPLGALARGCSGRWPASCAAVAAATGSRPYASAWARAWPP